MAYENKEIDHEKRKTGTGSYSPYNWIYHYLLDNFEPKQHMPLNVLKKEYRAYCLKCGIPVDNKQMSGDIQKAIYNFNSNNGSHGDTAHNLGNMQSNSADNIRMAIQDLKW